MRNYVLVSYCGGRRQKCSVSAFISIHRIFIWQEGLKLRETVGTPELVVTVKNQKKVKSQLQMV